MRLGLTVIGALLLAIPVAAQKPTHADTTAAVDAVFSSYTSPEAPGCAVGISRDGRAVLTRAYGAANLEHHVQNTPQSIFDAGSASKQVTAGAVLMLAQEGKVSLDDDIRKYFPELPDYGTAITVRHLINHTSGLRDWERWLV